MAKILAGDVGGTKTVLALFDVSESGLEEVRKTTYPSGQHDDFNALIAEFLGDGRGIDAACFGIAGPIKAQRCVTTNLPWVIDAQEISELLCGAKVHLLNDLESAAYGVLQLESFQELNPNADELSGHKAVIAAGTGLGEAILFFDGEAFHAMPTEGGHCEFAPQNELEDGLLVYLRAKFAGHVSLERILSGDGFGHLYDYLKSIDYAPINADFEQAMAQAEDRNAFISLSGLKGSDKICEQALAMFCRIYGVAAGSLALKCLPKGGIYVAGGIAPKIQTALKSGEFMAGFLDKGRMTHAIEQIPVRIVDNPEAPLLGAAHYATRLV